MARVSRSTVTRPAAAHPIHRAAVAASCESTGIRLHIPVSKKLVQQLLPKSLELKPIPGLKPDQHLIIADMVQIRGGKGHIGGRDLHSLSRDAGTVMGSLAGAMFLMPGLGAKLGGALGESVARTGSSLLGQYEELMLVVPNTRKKGGDTDYQYVLGMRLNSETGERLERAANFGFKKQQADIRVQPFSRYEVRGGALAFSADVTPTRGWGSPPAGQKNFTAFTGQPLLGHLGTDRFAVSSLRRDYTSLSQARGSVDIQGSSLNGAALSGDSGTRGFQSFLFQNAPTTLTWPTHVKVTDL